MVDITTIMMVKEQIKEKAKYLEENKTSFLKKINIAMIVIISIIAIILIDVIYEDRDLNKKNENIDYSTEDIVFVECTDEVVNKFINNYFKARSDLNFPKIFSSYGRDYYKEKREDKKGIVKNIEDSIRYEKTFVRGYYNIKPYVTKGLNDGDLVCIVYYDLLFGFTDGGLPEILLIYLTKNENSYVIKDNIDVGTSKYLIACVNTEAVKNLYEEVKTRITRLLISDESLKLAYNSLRQYEMNMDGDINYEKNKLIDNFGIVKLDPIKDADYIYDYIVEKKNEEKKAKELNDYIEKITSSISNKSTESNIK